MFVHRLAEPIDFFDDLTPLPDWLRSASNEGTRWALQAVLALADAGSEICWRGDMRHLPSVGVTNATPYLVVKQDDNGSTFVVTASPAPPAAATVSFSVPVRRIGAWAHPTPEDMAPTSIDALVLPPQSPSAEPPF